MTGGVPAADLVLGAGLLASVLCTVLPSSRFAQSMGLLGLGVLTTLAWLRLGSVDVALAEAGIGGGILAALLVWVSVGSPAQPSPDAATAPRWTWLRPVVGTLSAITLIVVAAAVWLRAEQSLPAWDAALTANMGLTGVEHEITGVLLVFRFYDTLLESAVLMLTAVAVLALGHGDVGPRAGLSGALSPAPPIPASLHWLIRVFAPVLFLAGLWLLFAGSTDSGGAFQSGAVLCAVLILLHSAHVPLGKLTVSWLRPVLVAGVVVFILAALAHLNAPFSFPVLLTIEILLTLGIAAGLYAIYLCLDDPARREVTT
ncbi:MULTISPECIES: hydrogenase subunit MbhD domain-containing protein [unclassified Nesterenkonia]|uniref:hydrogenase subunit MbhD domain-containing protein n=1 Tax=unclassified Nesterenkonia TaxID=2629769 RepID=UPI001F4CB76A|nr:MULTISPECIES: hydrogenase subunit MbhD domain-containing protein [unclassified Nesterenkonia]MCH8560962.1 hypothetical protein [Nesterenkonia sp. DZ6]MCH8571042.1 hypothetical protein [Nesterenkonia sp. AY15]